MIAYLSFQVSYPSHIPATLLTLRSRKYSSMELTKLQQLGVDFAEVATTITTSAVIVDHSAVDQMGAGFVGELIGLWRSLRQRRIELIVAGDQTEVLRLVGAGAWCRLCSDLDAAFHLCSFRGEGSGQASTKCELVTR